MRLLALETATEACSVALWVDGAVIERHELAPRRHAELVLPMVDAVLAEGGISRRALDAIAVGRGPGAFTGVRLAIAVAQGLALALDRPVVPVSTLAALALAAAQDAGAAPILAAIDARMGEVYAGCFRADAQGLVEPIAAELLAPPHSLLLPAQPAWRVVGSGWLTYRDLISPLLGDAAIAYEDGAALPRAAAIARLGARDHARGLGVDAASAQPVYLRDKVALTLAEQGKG
ncbi:MAG TPA: tRNA (adenosine(37)-N6)-threonylcarbamoyltransferase complex dimerization subunit type 1 TsaB [Pseudomonadota bacterium]|nr:tRNA (adenosine(37)-N6)-threonylcarbamoyltransferase complex dimerization subunit type 1 TsaB [Xanthomonadales bacterium]MBP7417182.1 tRNA (adenosine(37)-N6)-threonylcarbamoyltransferase complex dimerization subunit type 1 TsaB [Xanthomonadales bacterium]HQX23408.1 tRNA (adenosine(37)-N6)-threonylcarbamoyltransferase complex dimerization subunit type 1 TsaB [Pseudomonadota bacterium]HQY35081.1 tRNA (adenosine(37)-N6)-threonylcarbamoyltransferase complex dimerization subunit type 1 TsaB [Pseud